MKKCKKVSTKLYEESEITTGKGSEMVYFVQDYSKIVHPELDGAQVKKSLLRKYQNGTEVIEIVFVKNDKTFSLGTDVDLGNFIFRELWFKNVSEPQPVVPVTSSGNQTTNNVVNTTKNSSLNDSKNK